MKVLERNDLINLNNKKVALVGPSNNVFCHREIIDGSDIVIRFFENLPHISEQQYINKDIGIKTDILVLYNNEPRELHIKQISEVLDLKHVVYFSKENVLNHKQIDRYLNVMEISHTEMTSSFMPCTQMFLEILDMKPSKIFLCGMDLSSSKQDVREILKNMSSKIQLSKNMNMANGILS